MRTSFILACACLIVLPSCATGPSAHVKLGTDGVSAGVDFVRKHSREYDDRPSIVNSQNIELNRLK